MAFTDFDLLSQQVNALPIVGTAILNGALTSPLASSGVYCRQHVHNQNVGDNNASVMQTLMAASVDGGVFIDTHNAYSLSFRATVRVASGLTSGHGYVALAAYLPTLTPGLYSGGYELALQLTPGSAARLAIRAGQPANTFDAGIRNSYVNHQVTCAGSYAVDSWYRIRFDVIPISLTQKRLDAYTSPLGGDDWTLVGTFISSSLDSHWRNVGRSGIVALVGSPSTTGHVSYVDDFSAYVSVG